LLHFNFRITQNTILLLRASFYVAVNLYCKRYLLPSLLERSTGTYPEPLIPTTHSHTLFPLTSHLYLGLPFLPSTLNNWNFISLTHLLHACCMPKQYSSSYNHHNNISSRINIFWGGGPKERHHLKDLDLDGRIIFERILKK